MRTRKVLASGVVVALTAALTLTLVSQSAFAATFTNACRNSAVPTNWDQINVTMNATAPATTTAGASITLSGISMTMSIPGAIFVAGYNLGLLTAGTNNIPGDIHAVIDGSNTVEGSQSTNTVSTTITTVITDPNGVPGTGDETATDASATVSFTDQTWTAGASGTLNFREHRDDALNGVSGGGVVAVAHLGGGALNVQFHCTPGSVVNSGQPVPPAVVTFADAPAVASTTIVLPPTAPVCTDFSASVGVTQSIPIDLNPHCSDVNGNLDNTTFTLSSPGAGQGTLVAGGSPGTWTYTAPAVDPGVPVVLNFQVSDTTSPTPLTSNVGHLTITILANQCDATSAPCSLNEIVVQPVVGTTLTMSKVPGVVLMSTITLNGQPQVSGGLLQELTVINARGTGNSWSVTGYATDLGDASSPTGVVPPGITIPMCSAKGSLGGVLGPQAANRHCIPGDNLGWQPSAAVAHALIPGDVAQVTAGPSMMTNASDWLSQLIAGYPNTAGTTPNGLGGLGETNLLCTAPTDHSGGTFHCDAGLALGVPASAAAGTFTGGLVLTLA